EGEKASDEGLSKRMAALCDVFVMGAFGTAHRAQASTYGVAKHAPVACAGPLLTAALDALGRALHDPWRPFVAVVGGAKVSTKLTVLEALAQKVDVLIVGGGIANTFIAAAGHGVGKSLHEPDMLDIARRLAADETDRARIPVPVDVVVAKELSASAEPVVRPVDAVADDELILDIGPESRRVFGEILRDAGTIIWNGPVGVFEHDAFGEGTRAVAEAIAASRAFSLAGGGDTLAAIDKYGVASGISYISTGGGAFLEFVEGKQLPAVAVLEERGRGCACTGVSRFRVSGNNAIIRAMERLHRRTKIVATLGPATDDPERLTRMVQGGLDVARINFSHGNRDDQRARVKRLREVAERCGR